MPIEKQKFRAAGRAGTTSHHFASATTTPAALITFITGKSFNAKD